MTRAGRHRNRDIGGSTFGSNQFHTMDTAQFCLPAQLGRTWRLQSGRNPTGQLATQTREYRGILASHLKHSRWNVAPKARTNCPVRDSPQLLQMRLELPGDFPCDRPLGRARSRPGDGWPAGSRGIDGSLALGIFASSLRPARPSIF